MIRIIILLIILAVLFWPQLIAWATSKRMTYRHYVTRLKISILKVLHEIGLL